jgi:hypothetical protein
MWLMLDRFINNDKLHSIKSIRYHDIEKIIYG